MGVGKSILTYLESAPLFEIKFESEYQTGESHLIVHIWQVLSGLLLCVRLCWELGRQCRNPPLLSESILSQLLPWMMLSPERPWGKCSLPQRHV